MHRFVIILLTIPLWSTSLLAQRIMLEETMGDLDQDGTQERIVVYSNNIDTLDVETREIHIFKGTDDDWTLWQQFDGGVLPSQKDASAEEPFVSMEVKKGLLIFYHAGGGKDQWNYKHYFRYHQERFELVQAQISFGALCEGFTNIDFDLLTGLLSYKQESDNCNQGGVNQVLVDKKELVYLEQLPLLQHFIPGKNRTEVPGTDLVFFY